MSPTVDRAPRRLPRGRGAVLARLHAGIRLLLVVLTVGLALAVVPAGTPVDADGGPFVEDQNYWRFSPNSADNQGDHQVKLYPATPWIQNHFIEIIIPGEDYETADYFTGGRNDIESTVVTWSGPPGMEARQGANPWTIYVGCVVGQGSCTDPAGWSVTAAVTFSAQSGDCVRNHQPGQPSCPRSSVTVTNTRRYVFVDAPDLRPDARFDHEIVSTDPPTAQFTNFTQSNDYDSLEYSWDFGDGTTSTDRDPRHTYAEAGSYEVRLQATDQYGSDTYVGTVNFLPSGLIVNSTGDSPALDVDQPGCDTGGTVGPEDAPECTLRAAIETANHRGTGAISFDIAGSGVPTITPATALPALTGAVTIDGRDGAAAGVRVSGGSLPGAVIKVESGQAEIRGLAIDGANPATGVEVVGGTAVIEGNVIGADPTGTSAGSLGLGVLVGNDAVPGVEVRDNVVAAQQSITILGSGTEISGNRVGVSPGGSALGDGELGIAVAVADTVVEDNVVRAKVAGIVVLQGALFGTVTGVEVRGNRVGTPGSGQPFADQGEGIRLDGVSDTEVVDNVVAAGLGAGISVTGRAQIAEDGDKLTFLRYENSGRADSPLTGGQVSVSGNTVAGAGEPSARNGIIVWEDAAEVTVSGNTVTGQRMAGIEVHGGSGHRIVGNQVGGAGGDAAGTIGILVDATPGAVIGANGVGNRVRATERGIVVEGATTGAVVEANELVADGASEESGGIAIPEEATPVAVRANQVEDFGIGVSVDAPAATIESNVVRRGGTGISSNGANAELTENVVVATTEVAIASNGAEPTIEENKIGIDGSGGTAAGNAGAGLVVTTGPAKVNRNQVVGSGEDGIAVGPGVVATLRANRIADSDGDPIAAGGPAPVPPTIAAAIQTSYEGEVRTTLVVTDLPDDETGIIEVFANDDCTSGEAEKVLGVTKTSKAGVTYRIIQLIDREDDDHFTVTFTDTQGRTSALSGCTSIGNYPDGDGDGVPDPIDALFDAEDDPTKAVVITDQEELLGIAVAPFDEETGVGGGRLSAVAAVTEPAGLPAGASLPYGAIAFEVEGLEPGAIAVVSLVGLGGESIAGTSYWKYGPQVPGGPDGWYDFSYDETPGTGAVISDATDIPGWGIRRGFNLVLRDGARGDSDGFTDGRIVDPGGPAFAPDGPIDPPDPEDPDRPVRPWSPVVPSTPGSPGDPEPGDPDPTPVDPANPGEGPGMPGTPGVPAPAGPEEGSPGATPSPNAQGGPAAPGAAPATGAPGTRGPLPRTGAEHGVPVALALWFLGVGIALVVGTSRTPGSRPRSATSPKG